MARIKKDASAPQRSLPACRSAGYLPAGREHHHEILRLCVKFKKQRRVYVGLTKNIEQRIKEHNSGKSTSTKGYRPWKLFYAEEFDSLAETRGREKKLKSGSGKEFLKQKLNDNPS